MNNHLNASDNSLTTKQGKDKQIQRFLKAVPHLEFSEKGLQNISNRFGVSLEYLQYQINLFSAEGCHNG